MDPAAAAASGATTRLWLCQAASFGKKPKEACLEEAGGDQEDGCHEEEMSRFLPVRTGASERAGM